jgi:hypothetical protein
MARDSGDQQFSKTSARRPSRREVIVTAAGVGVAGMLPETAGAYTTHERHTRRRHFDTAMLKNSFCNLVAAFNNGTAWNSPQLFDANVIMISVKQHHQYTGWSEVSMALQGLAGFLGLNRAQFIPVPGKVKYDSKNGVVQGAAYWHDNDGSVDDEIQFKFIFDSSGVVNYMKGTPGSGYKGSYPPPSDCP